LGAATTVCALGINANGNEHSQRNGEICVLQVGRERATKKCTRLFLDANGLAATKIGIASGTEGLIIPKEPTAE
jgi:hypothetical protein